jgi:hypothetical protein
MAKGKSYQRYSASFKKMPLTKAAEEGMQKKRPSPGYYSGVFSSVTDNPTYHFH